MTNNDASKEKKTGGDDHLNNWEYNEQHDIFITVNGGQFFLKNVIERFQTLEAKRKNYDQPGWENNKKPKHAQITYVPVPLVD